MCMAILESSLDSSADVTRDSERKMLQQNPNAAAHIRLLASSPKGSGYEPTFCKLR